MGSLLTAFALIGVGFNEKMLQAYMVLPAFYLFYVLAAKVNWKRKTGVLAASTAILLVVSLSWAVIVDSIPASKRPYIGSSGTNSVLNLAFGYNGVARLTGDRGAGGGGGGMPGMNGGEMPNMNGEMPAMNGEMPNMNGEMPAMNGSGSNSGTDGGRAAFPGRQGTNSTSNSQTGDDDGGAPGQPPSGTDSQGRQFGGDDGRGNRGGMNGSGSGGGMFNTGTAGPLRLFQSELSGQASWMLPFVLLGIIGLFANLRRRTLPKLIKKLSSG